MRSPTPREPLITLAATAEHLGMPVQTLYDWRKHGRGPKGYRLGGRVMFRLSEVEHWLQQQREPDCESVARHTGRRWSA